MMLLWSLLIITFILSAVGMLPTHWYTGPANWLLAKYRSHGEAAMLRELERLSAGVPFNAAVSFLPRNIGLAADTAVRKLFLAVHEDGKLRATLVPFAEVASVTQGERRDNGFYDYFVDVAVTGTDQPWCLVCGEKPELAAEIKSALDTALSTQ